MPYARLPTQTPFLNHLQAAAGLPLSDLFDHELDIALGGSFWESPHTQQILERVAPVWWGAVLGLVAAGEMYEAQKSTRSDYTTPGLLGFDPCQFFPSRVEDQKRVLGLEIQIGRVAMLAMGIYLLQEYSSMTPGSTWEAIWLAIEQW